MYVGEPVRLQLIQQEGLYSPCFGQPVLLLCKLSGLTSEMFSTKRPSWREDGIVISLDGTMYRSASNNNQTHTFLELVPQWMHFSRHVCEVVLAENKPIRLSCSSYRTHITHHHYHISHHHTVTHHTTTLRRTHSHVLYYTLTITTHPLPHVVFNSSPYASSNTSLSTTFQFTLYHTSTGHAAQYHSSSFYFLQSEPHISEYSAPASSFIPPVYIVFEFFSPFPIHSISCLHTLSNRYSMFEQLADEFWPAPNMPLHNTNTGMLTIVLPPRVHKNN